MGTPRFTPEFKEEAVKQVAEWGYPLAKVADRLGVSAHSLYKWVKVIAPDNKERQSRELREAKGETPRLYVQMRRL